MEHESKQYELCTGSKLALSIGRKLYNLDVDC